MLGLAGRVGLMFVCDVHFFDADNDNDNMCERAASYLCVNEAL